MININKENQENLLVFATKENSLDIDSKILYLIEKAGLDIEKSPVITPLGMEDIAYKQIFILNLGEEKSLTPNVLQEKLGKFIINAKNNIKSLDILNNLPAKLAFTLGECLSVSMYHYKGIVREEKPLLLENINVVSKKDGDVQKGINYGKCVNTAQELINKPSNELTPEKASQFIRKFAKLHKLEIETIKGDELEERGFGGIYAVGKGSDNIPYLNVVKYKGNPLSKDYKAIIGKGITFDSGGISLKPSANMKNMICDMGGFATMFAAFKYIVVSQAKANVIAFFPLAENMPSSHAYKPGDVITMKNNMTVDIVSTDAEGRMLLADCISYANELGAKEIFEASTLTGSCANFLGDLVTGYYCTNEKLASKVDKYAKENSEYLWHLPPYPFYKDLLKSHFADLLNSSRKAGGITAGVFLNEFAEDTPFVHFDVAGTAFADSNRGMFEKGGSVMIGKTIIDLLK